MLSHRMPVLIVCALTVAACQPSQAPARQTQEAQSAFNLAIAAAQTQAASSPTPVPSPTQASTPAPTSIFSFPTRPAPSSMFNLLPARTAAPGFALIPTSLSVPDATAAAWQSQASALQSLLDEHIGLLGPVVEEPLDVHVTSLRYVCSPGCRPASMDIVVQHSYGTNVDMAAAGTLRALSDIFSTELYPYDGLMRQRSLVPQQMERFLIHVQDPRGWEYSRLSGKWADLIAYGAGSLSADGLIDRVEYMRAY